MKSHVRKVTGKSCSFLANIFLIIFLRLTSIPSGGGGGDSNGYRNHTFTTMQQSLVNCSYTYFLTLIANQQNRCLEAECLFPFRKYKLITTYEQRCLYKKDFQTEYEEYKALKEKIDSVSTKFTELQSKRLQFPVKSTERQVRSTALSFLI